MATLYEELAESYLGVTEGKGSARDAFCRSRGTFQLRGSFDDTSKFVAHRFAVDFSDLFGDQCIPLDLSSGCISVKMKFDNISDYRGITLPDLLESDPQYHQLFRDYCVSRVTLVWFPTFRNRTRMYRIGEQGKPSLF